MPETIPPQEPMIVRMPIVRLVQDGQRTVFQVVGSTIVPPASMNGSFMGPNGYVSDISEAVDVRGPVGGSAAGTQGPKGDPGIDGKDAFTIWLEQGHSGSRAAFLASLKGQQGDQGTQGLKGDKGDTGDTGLRGEQGPSGAVGPAGPTGAKGDTGSAGAQGPQGLKGDTGAQGVKGDTGASGQTFLRQINVAENAQLLALTSGMTDKRYACAGAVVGERYTGYIRGHRLNGATTTTAGRPANYWLISVDCQVADTINVVIQRPAIALLGGGYELFTDIVKVNAS